MIQIQASVYLPYYHIESIFSGNKIGFITSLTDGVHTGISAINVLLLREHVFGGSRTSFSTGLTEAPTKHASVQ